MEEKFAICQNAGRDLVPSALPSDSAQRLRVSPAVGLNVLTLDNRQGNKGDHINRHDEQADPARNAVSIGKAQE